MKKLFIVFGLVVMLFEFGCLERANVRPASATDPLLRAHFAGTVALAHNTNAPKLREVLALPSGAAVRDLALQKFAAAPVEFWRKHLPPGATAQTNLFRPLLEDILSAESWMEIRGSGDRAETVLAVQISDERAQIWNGNLRSLAQAWKLGTPSDINIETFKGWELKRKETPNLLQFVRAGKWVIVGLGQDRLAMLPDLAKQVNRNSHPVAGLQNSVLDIEADWPRLADWFPAMASCRLPPAHLVISSRGENLRSELKLAYSEKIPWKFEPWKIPTNIICEPLASFTVGQGIAPLLAQVKGVPELGIKELPNQFCAWALSLDIHYFSYAVMPITQPSNVVKQIAPRVPLLVEKQMGKIIGNFLWASNRSEIVWRGMPFIAPFLKPAHVGDVDYLLSGMYPLAPKTNPPPPELFAQISGRKDLAYYDWEITQVRLLHARQFYKLLDIVNQRQSAGEETPTQKWLRDLAPHLGNTITEVSLASPKELNLVRKSHFGFTGFELATLMRWLDSSGFPLTFDRPPPLVLQTNASTIKPQASPPKTKPPEKKPQ